MTVIRKEVRGGAGTLTLAAAITPASMTLQANGSVSGFPTGVTYPFVIKLDPGGALEKVLCSGLSGSNPGTIDVIQRGWDGTTALDHQANVNIQHCLDADTLEGFFEHVFDDTRDDHSQYMLVNGARAFTDVDALVDVPVDIGTSNQEGTSPSLARADHEHQIGNGAIDTLAMFTDDLITGQKIAANSIGASELADASVDTAAVIDHAITQVKIEASQQIPTGVVHIWAGAAAPTGWQVCDGSALDRTTFATLFAVVGTAFGVGDGVTTFNVPDLRGRVPVGVDNKGGSDAGRISVANTRGTSGGEEKHTLVEDEIPDLTVPTYHSGASTVAGRIGDTATAGVGVVSTSATLQRNGTPGGSHSNMQPFQLFNYIIKT